MSALTTSLRSVLEAARLEEKCSRQSLTVLQADPYRLDTAANHRDGAWVAEQLDRAISPHRRIHWRGLHYALVALGDVVKPDGELYRNIDQDWSWLSNDAGKEARWLGYIDFQRITDNRNSVIHRTAEITSKYRLYTGLDITIPEIDDIDPLPCLSDFEGRQPYALAIFGEKASLENVLLPIARRFMADLYLPSGEISDSLLWRMAKDGAADGRPLAVFTITDFDPAGYQMSVSIGRKLQALRDLCFPALEFEVVPVALSAQQVSDLNLPSTPLKDTERRADRWREAFGSEQTEIDALATLRPSELTRIVESAIEPYFDSSLNGRVRAAKDDWQDAAQEALEDQIDPDTLSTIREQAARALEECRFGVESINRRMRAAVQDVELPAPVLPAAEIDAEKLGRQAPLIASSWSWAEATRALRARKAYAGGWAGG